MFARRVAVEAAAKSSARSRVAGVLSALVLCGACASGPAEIALPAPDPFPTWVEGLQPGLTLQEDVRARFGKPAGLEERGDGRSIWHYTHPEIRYAELDPDDPLLHALEDAGTTGPPEHPRLAAAIDRGERGWHIFTAWWDRTFFFPPRQPRPPHMRRVPATLHELDVHFGPDGVVEQFEYASREASTPVPVVQ